MKIKFLILLFLSLAINAQAQKDTSTFFASVHGTVWAMKSVGDSFYIAGKFDSIAGIAANSIARWNGTSWSTLGSGIHGDVRVLVDDGNGGLYAGGKFDSAGGMATSNIAHWDGTQWDSLGSGVNDTIFALFNTDTLLYCGGAFTSAGSIHALRVANWNNLNDWDSMAPNNLNGTVRGIGPSFAYPPIGIVGEFTDFSNFGTYNAPLYFLSTLYMYLTIPNIYSNFVNIPVIGGKNTLEAFLTKNDPFNNLSWLDNEIVHGTMLGIAPIGSRSFLAWGNFDTIDKVFLPGFGLFDGIQWRTIHIDSQGTVTCAGYFPENSSFFSVNYDSIRTAIFSYNRPDTIIALFTPSVNGGTLYNDSSSNTNLLFHYAFGIGENCSCMIGCEYSGSIPPGQSTSIGSEVEQEEFGEYGYYGAEIDNSTNEVGPNGVSGGGGRPDLIQPPHPAMLNQVSISQISDGVMITEQENKSEKEHVKIYNEIGQCVKDVIIGAANPTFISSESLHGLIFVRVEMKDGVITRSFIFE